MKRISQHDLDALCQYGQALDLKGDHPAVVIHPDGTVTKFWTRKKRWLSSATLRPYSRRFVDNAHALARRGITVPEIINHAQLENSHIRIVTYRALPGNSIRELLNDAPEQVDLPKLCRFIARLHQRGVLYRGIHLGNIIQPPERDGYGLIDFTDVRFFSRPLSLQRRASNLATPLRYREDTDLIASAGMPALEHCYLEQLDLSPAEQKRFLSLLQAHRR